MASDPDTSKTDEALLEGLRAGNPHCAEQLASRYWAPIQRFCMTYLADEQVAEDVTQDTLAKATGDELPDGAFKPWAYKLARNRCLDILRRRGRSPTYYGGMKTGFDAPRHSSGPRTKAAREERREQIREIIGQMPEEYRSVLTLKHFEGFSRAEMAESLGVTETTVKGRLVRASEYLREELRKITGTY